MDVRRWIGLALGLALFGCDEEAATGASSSSQTHWLRSCEGDSDCGDLRCVCGVCAERCGAEGQCATAGVTTACQVAASAPAQALCEGETPVDVCLQVCSASAPCPSGQRCVEGACLPEEPPASQDDAGAGGDGGMCVAQGDPCTIVGEGPDPCCDGSSCAADACTTSDPPTCAGTCRADEGALRWYTTCGDPVCGPPEEPPPGEGCTSEVEGEACSQEGASCETGQCGASLVCAKADPKLQPGGCPISRARYKRDIHYLDEAQRRDYASELLSLPLATYRYRNAEPGTRPQLGFIIEDVEPSASVDAPRDRVDLYGYTSMAVAALQVQAGELEAMRAELTLLRERLAEMERSCR